MIENTLTAGSYPEILPMIATFRELRNEDPSNLTEDDTKRLFLMEEVLEPRRVVGNTTARRPVRIPAKRRAWFISGGQIYWAETVEIGPRRIRVALAEKTRLKNPVVVEVEGHVKNVWWRFSGRIVGVGRNRSIFTMQLRRFLGCAVGEVVAPSPKWGAWVEGSGHDCTN
jgi:hypothetical protein